jgi:cell division protein ZapA (FtsZ GTPase activity inhibitor)
MIGTQKRAESQAAKDLRDQNQTIVELDSLVVFAVEALGELARAARNIRHLENRLTLIRDASGWRVDTKAWQPLRKALKDLQQLIVDGQRIAG